MILTRSVDFEGRGLHGGRSSRLVLRPAPAGSGLGVVLGGRARPITSLEMNGRSRSTVLRAPGSTAKLAGVEHLLAALSGLDLWDAILEPEGDEVPVLDGSALPFARAIRPALEEAAAPDALVPPERLRVQDGEAWIEVEPSSGLTLDVAVEFPHPRVGAQRFVWSREEGSFLEDLGPSRTFGFLEELPELARRGLAAGGGLDCALVFDSSGVLNPEGPRFPDEPVRHKMLDIVGDLALLGAPLHVHLRAHRPSHSLNHELVRSLRRCCHAGGGKGKVDA